VQCFSAERPVPVRTARAYRQPFVRPFNSFKNQWKRYLFIHPALYCVKMCITFLPSPTKKLEAIFVHTKHRLLLCFVIAFQLSGQGVAENNLISTYSQLLTQQGGGFLRRLAWRRRQMAVVANNATSVVFFPFRGVQRHILRHPMRNVSKISIPLNFGIVWDLYEARSRGPLRQAYERVVRKGLKTTRTPHSVCSLMLILSLAYDFIRSCTYLIKMQSRPVDISLKSNPS